MTTTAQSFHKLICHIFISNLPIFLLPGLWPIGKSFATVCLCSKLGLLHLPHKASTDVLPKYLSFKGFPSSLSFSAIPAWNYSGATIHFQLHPYTEITHPWTKLRFFSLLSKGHEVFSTGLQGCGEEETLYNHCEWHDNQDYLLLKHVCIHERCLHLNLNETGWIVHFRAGLTMRTVVTELENLNTIGVIAFQGGRGLRAALTL